MGAVGPFRCGTPPPPPTHTTHASIKRQRYGPLKTACYVTVDAGPQPARLLAAHPPPMMSTAVST